MIVLTLTHEPTYYMDQKTNKKIDNQYHFGGTYFNIKSQKTIQ